MGVTTVVKDYGTAILNAIRDNDLKTLRTIFEKHLNSDHKISALCTTDIKHKPTKKFACPLILAARQEDSSIIRYMMDRGVDPNFVHHTIYTSKRREIVTALHIAVDLGLFSTVEVLLNANADPNITDHNEETSLHIAVKKSDRVMTRMLLAKGADPSVLDRRGNAPLHIATLYGHLQLVKTLLKYDADVYQKGHLGAIPSHIAAREGHIHLIQVFCSRDVGNINIKIPCFVDQREKAPIHLAAENGHVETVLALVDQFSAEVNLRDSDGNTALHCTVLHSYHPYKMRDKDYFYATAKALVKYRVAINEKNKFGETALHLAAANHYQKIVELLLSVGANPFAENDQHLKPIDVVPESDPVTKQLLKNAMAHPRTAPLSASMLSLQRDLNISAMGLPGAVNHRLAPAMMMNGIPPQMADPNRGSFHSVSSMSSVFIDDIRARQNALQAKPPKGVLPTVGEHRARDEHQNEIQPYGTRGSRREKHKSRRQHGDSSSITGSQLSINSLEENSGKRGERSHKGRRERSSSTVERQNAKNEKRSKNHVAEKPYDDEDVFEHSTPEVTPSKPRLDKKDRNHVYENLRFREKNQEEESKRARRDRRKQEKQQTKDAELGLVPYGARNDYQYGEDEGVKVHTIPGKPSMIEVQYDRGPITISVDTHGNSFDALPPYGQLEQDSDLEFGWGDGEDFEEEEPEKVDQRHKKQKSKRGKELDEDEEEEVEERSRKKRGKEKETESVYSNQEQLLEEMRRKQRQSELLKRRKSMEEREARMREEAEKRREEQEEEERRARLEEEKTRKRARKLQRRRQRQEQYEQEQEFEGMPTEEEPPERPFIMELPEEVQNEPDFDSDSFEAEQETSRTAMIAATQRRVSATTESLKQRWSQGEDEGEEEQLMEKSATRPTATVGQGNGAPVPAKRPVKPPRPSVGQTDEELEAMERVEHETSRMEEDELKSTEVSGGEVKGQERPSTEVGAHEKPGTEAMSQEKLGTEVRGQERPNTEMSRYQTYQTMLIEKSQTDVIRMETVATLKETKPTDGVQKQDVLLEYEEEPGSVSHWREASSQGDAIRPGLNMRVTGEVPKAFNRREKSSARTAFMLAAPVGIESSSEASDSELGGSRSSLTRSPALEQLSAQRHKEWSEPLKPVYGKSPTGSQENVARSQQPAGSKYSIDAKGKVIGSYAKPYESFGPIETKTDALEEAIQEAQRALDEQQQLSDSSLDVSGHERYPHANELSTFSANASTKVNVDLSSERRSQPARGQDLAAPQQGAVSAASVQDAHLPTILSTPTKVSRQFQNVQEVSFGSESLAGQGITSVVQGVVVPVVSHGKETDIVSTETEDDFFDDESFDDISEYDHLEEASAQAEQLNEESRQTSEQNDDVTAATKASSIVSKTEIPAEVLSPPDLLQGPHSIKWKAGDLSRSAESLGSFKEELEVYDKEPGARNPRPRIGGTESNDRFKEEEDRARDDKTVVAAVDASRGKSRTPVSTGERLPEDEEVAKINSKAEAKRGAKKTKKNKKTVSKNQTEETTELASVPKQLVSENGEFEGSKEAKEGTTKKAKGKQKKTKKAELAETNKVWKEEPMEFKPLASSEMFESVPSSNEHFMVLNLRDDTTGGSEIIEGSEGVVGELPKRTVKKKGEKKRQQLPKNTEHALELQKRFLQGMEPKDVPEDDASYSNSLDIVIPPIESKWKNLQDQSIDNSLDVSIPALDVKYFQMENADESSKWKAVRSGREISGLVNLDDIIIPRSSDFGDEDSFSPGQDRQLDDQKMERIVGRRQQRLIKQGFQSAGTKAMANIPETNLDDLSSIDDQESSRTFNDESRDDESRTGQTNKKGVADRKQKEESEAHSLNSKVLEQSIDEDMDLLPPGVRTVPPEKPKIPFAPKVVTKPFKPQKPQHLSAGVTPTTKSDEKLSSPSKPMPVKRQIQPMPNGTSSALAGLWSSYSAGAEIVEVPSEEQGFRPVAEQNGVKRPPAGHALPRFPPTPFGEGRSGVLSDTELSSRNQQRIGKYGRLGPVHSEAEASDLEMPIFPGPGKSYRQAALETINRRPRGLTFVLRQPGHHDKSFAYLRKLYKPQARHSVTRHLLPTAGRYGDSELSRMTRRSATESEGDTDNEYSYLFDDERSRGALQQRQGLPATGRGRGKAVTIREGMTRGRPGHVSRRDEPPRIMEPGPVDFSKYDVTARLWMEQVDRKTVQKSETMYLSVLPQGQELPEEIIRRAKYQSALAGDSSTIPLQWVMARGRAIAQKSRLAGEPRPDCGNLSGYESDLNLFRPSSPSGRQLILFFKVGSNWLDLAWVLFDGLQGDSDTVRMIKDIQLKNPDRLTEQVHDLMQRWWKKKGAEATIEELQKALDTIHLAYIHEEYFDPRASFVPHTDTEDELDVGEVSDADPNVSRLVQEFEVRSLNASFVGDSGPQIPAEELNPEVVLRTLQKARGVAPGSTALYTRASRTSRAESRDSSFERPPGKPNASHLSSQERLNESSGDERRHTTSSNQKLKKNWKHETNL